MPVGKAKEPEVVRRRLAGETITQIAEVMGVGPPAISDTLRKPAVRAELAKQRDAVLARVRDDLVGLSNEAVGVLCEIMLDKTVSAAVRKAAATDVLDRIGVVRGAALLVRREPMDDEDAIAELEELWGAPSKE